MWVWVTSTKLRACARCCSSDGLATIDASELAAAAAAVADEALAAVGVAAETSTGGGDTGALARPTTPVSTAISAARPTAATAIASSHAPRSEGGDGGGAYGLSSGVSDTAPHPTRAPRRSCWCRVPALMRTPALFLSMLATAACFACAGLASANASLAAATRATAPSTPSSTTSPSAPALGPAQQRYLALAQAGVAQAERRWSDPRRGWYDARLGDRERYPLATIWDIVPLFESLDAIAIAQPTAANRRAVKRFAAGAERYLNRGLRPVPGYSPYPGDRSADTQTWFDDNGWWGLAFLNAYRATGTQRYLLDAQRALAYIAAAGWDRRAGGIWWNTSHPYKAGEALASGTLLATLLYRETRSTAYLATARMFLAWANTAGFSSVNG